MEWSGTPKWGLKVLNVKWSLRNTFSWWAPYTLRPLRWLVSYQSSMDPEWPCNPGKANTMQTAHSRSVQVKVARVLEQDNVLKGLFTGKSIGSS